MLREIGIKNYKSILDHTIELGRFNVFIGENGCGKTNILEAVAMASAALTNKLDIEELYSKGIRIAKPSITFSSFLNTKPTNSINIRCYFLSKILNHSSTINFQITTKKTELNNWSSNATLHGKLTPPHAHAHITSSRAAEDQKKELIKFLLSILDSRTKIPLEEAKEELISFFNRLSIEQLQHLDARLTDPSIKDKTSSILDDFSIYNIGTQFLRGIQTLSLKTPLGINGENLDVHLSTFSPEDMKELVKRAQFITWLDKVLLDADDKLKLEGYKLGRSTSTLYFKDKFMARRNNTFSAENANEGILHALFYLSLFISSKTPAIFGIDNIETALNPQLCRDLTKELAALAKTHDKQALITTHNPAILDGLNLHDDEQRLFVVSRNDEGHTVTERIKLKPEVNGQKYKLSELWMRGHLGGLPTRF